jgi:hypothetical protein
MEQIPKSFIEDQEYFLRKLSKEDKLYDLNKYFDEQPFLMDAVTEMFKEIKGNNIFINCQHIVMVILHSYKYYGIPMSVIKNDVIVDIHERIGFMVLSYRDYVPSILELMQEMKTTINQDDIIEYAIFNLYGTEDYQIFYKHEPDAYTACCEIMVLILLLNNEMKKYIGDEVN